MEITILIRTLDDKRTTYTTTDQTKVIKRQLCLHLLDFDSKVLHEKMNRLIDPTKINNFLRLLILITFIFNCTAGAQSEKYETNASANSFKRHKLGIQESFKSQTTVEKTDTNTNNAL